MENICLLTSFSIPANQYLSKILTINSVTSSNPYASATGVSLTISFTPDDRMISV